MLNEYLHEMSNGEWLVGSALSPTNKGDLMGFIVKQDGARFNRIPSPVIENIDHPAETMVDVGDKTTSLGAWYGHVFCFAGRWDYSNRRTYIWTLQVLVRRNKIIQIMG